MIHKEGRVTIFITLFGLFLLNYGISFIGIEWLNSLIMLLSIAFLIIILQFFRNPFVEVEKNENHVLSVADGKVVVIEEVEESEYFKDKRIQVSVFMSPFNVHVNRNPISGVVKYFQYFKGLYLVAWHPKSSTENERTTCVIENSKGVEILFRQIAGALARRIVWYVKPGQNVNQGSEMGFIKFGSRIDIFLPLDAKVKVQLNQKVKGAKTILAELN